MAKKAGIEVIFNHIAEAKLTPDEYYMLTCIHQGISAPHINTHMVIRSLVTKGFVVENPEHTFVLQPDALSLISKIDSYFGVQMRKSNNTLMGEDFEANAEKYNEIFPRMKLPSNKPARSPLKEIVAAFREFFKEYDYGWEIIHQAAAYYIEEEEKKGFKYTRTSRYFIRKQDQDKTWISDLAAYCQLVKDGEDFSGPKHVEKTF